MSDDLRQRFAKVLDGLDYGHDQQERRYVFVDDVLEAVMAVRDEELEQLHRRVGWHGECVPITQWAEELRDKLNAVGQREQAAIDCRAALAESNKWRERADVAEATIARVREAHARDDSNPHGPWCGACMTTWPCPTIAALDDQEAGC